MKKRVLSIVLAALMLTACGEKTSDKEANKGVQYISGRGIYENGMTYSAGQSDHRVTRFLDFTSLETAPFCAVPNCTHSISSSECLSRVTGDQPILIGDSVYFFINNGSHGNGDIIETSEGLEFVMESKLMKASLDSSATELVCEFNDALTRTEDSFMIIGDILYFLAYDPDPYIDGMGGASWGSGGGYDFLCSINIKTGEYTNYGSICYVEDEYPAADNSSGARLCGYYDGKLWIEYSFLKEDIQRDENGIPEPDYVPEFTIYMYEFDPSVKEYVRSDMPEPQTITEEYYTYRDEETEKVNVISGDKTYTTGLDYCELIANNKVFYSDLNGCWWCSIGEETVYALNEEYKGYSVVAFHDGKYVLFNNRKAVKLSEEELIANSTIYEEE